MERSFESAEDGDAWVIRLGQGFRGFPSPRSDFQGSIESAKIWNRVVAFSEILEEIPMVEIEEREKKVEMKEEEQEKKFDPIPVHRVENTKRNKSFELDVEDRVRDKGFYHPVPLSMYEHGTSHRVYDTTSRSGVVSRSPRHEIVRRDWGACLKDDRNDGRTSSNSSRSRVTPRRGHEVRWRRGSGDAFLARSPVMHQQSK